MTYKFDDFYMKNLTLSITLRCTLKCRLCSVSAPYFSDPPHFSLDELKESIDAYFIVVPFVKHITITGGEPLVHQQIHKIVDYLIDNYSNRIQEMEIITNGTIEPNKELLQACSRFSNLYWMIDDYGHELSNKVRCVEEKLQKNGIKFKTRIYYGKESYYGGWVNFGDLKKKLFTQIEIEERFSKCAFPQKMNFCFSLSGGKLYPCQKQRVCIQMGVISENPNECINLLDTSISIQEKRDRIKAIQNSKSLSACAYCNGFNDDSERFIPAEQLQ
ncbi:radical SAM protein [Ruminiclostridium cellobioparum]|uniref:radical SAM protein n=1 Tax=Ruminiclostridium cellobioparum TaxID=29355 RepID=UPI0028B2658B|nr:radical SAM protein [Ruminiclostridium cellobioparum]